MTKTWMFRSLARETWNLVVAFGASADTGIDPAEPAVELVLELAQGEVGDIDLAHLGDDDEALAGHVEGVGLLDVAGQDEDQHVAGAQPVVLVHRPGCAGWNRVDVRRKVSSPEKLEPGAAGRQRIGQRVGPGGVRLHKPEGVENLLQRVGDDEHRILALE